MEQIISLLPFAIALLLTGGVAGILAGLLGVDGGRAVSPLPVCCIQVPDH